MLSGWILRLIIAVIVVIALFAIIPAALNIFGLPHSGDLLVILRVVIGALALLYVIKGTSLTIAA